MESRIRDIAPLECEPYAHNVISEYGNNTWFHKDSDIWLYIPETETEMTDRRLRYRVKKPAGEQPNAWTDVAISIDSTKHMMLAPTAISSNPANYEITTAEAVTTEIEGQEITELVIDSDEPTVFCNLNVVDVGTVSYSDGILSVSGYSSNLTPVWYQLYYRFDTAAGNYYSDANGKKMFIVEADGYGTMTRGWNRFFAEVTAPPAPTVEMMEDFFEREYDVSNPFPTYLGWCARVFYQTGYGYCRADVYQS